MGFIEFLIVVPIIALILGAVMVRSVWKREGGKPVLTAALAGAVLTPVVYTLLILRQTSSTAALGVIWVPLIACLGAVLFGGFAWLGMMVYRARKRPVGFAALALIVAAVFFAASQANRVTTFHNLESPAASPALLTAYFHSAMADRDYFLLSAIARNPKTPPRILLEMAQSPDQGLHQKRNSWINMFDRDGLAVVRKALRNPNLPDEAIPLLAHSQDDYVLGDVAGHARTPEPLLRELARKSNRYLIRWGLAGNRNTPPEILEQLIQPNESITDVTTERMLASNPGTPHPVLMKLAAHKDLMVRQQVAYNPALDAELGRALVADTDEMVRSALCLNRATPREICQQLRTDSSAAVRQRAEDCLRRSR